jgi:hypothetical protein
MQLNLLSCRFNQLKSELLIKNTSNCIFYASLWSFIDKVCRIKPDHLQPNQRKTS